MRWGALVAAACCAALAGLKWSEGEQVLGVVFAAAAVLYVALAIASYRKERTQTAARGPAEQDGLPPRDKIARTLDVFRARARGWLWLAGSGWVAATASVFTSLAVAVVMAALAAFATVRYRYYAHYTGVLERALGAEQH